MFPGFLPDYRLKIAHHHRVRVRPDHRTDKVIGIADVAHPVADGFVDGVFQRLAAGGYRAYFGAHQLHAVYVGHLAVYVLLAHVDDTVQVQHGADSGRRHTVLAGARLGDYPLFTHALGQ